ncbi:MAG: hypothetical protein EHM28_08320 [Spirochaetaceae bacterium]|nr:MAG: hypothetical protein EHM28_08320 [Spirochaetaceae bacterium]
MSQYTSAVEATNFDREIQVMQSEIQERFDPDDPRIDPYMKSLSAYFYVNDGVNNWNVMYIRTRLNPVYLSMLLAGIFKDSKVEWHIYELERTEITLVISIAGTLFLFLLLLFFTDQTWRIVMFSGLIPWISWAAGGGIGSFMLFFPCAFAWAMFSHELLVFMKNRILFKWEEPAKKPIIVTAFLYGVTILSGILFTFAEIPVYSIFFVILVQALISGIYALYLAIMPWWKKRNHLSHRTFQAVTLVKKYNPVRRGKWDRLTLRIMAIFLVVIPCMRLMSISVPRQMLPVPEKAYINAWWPSHEAMTSLKQKGDEGSLPDLSDYAAHIAFQERIAYGGMEYGIPEKDEEIHMPVFTMDASGKITKSRLNVISFNSAWYDKLQARPGDDSVARMLFEQGSPMTIRMRKQRGATDPYPVWTIIMNWCILLWPLLITHSRFFLTILHGVDKDTQLLLRELR